MPRVDELSNEKTFSHVSRYNFPSYKRPGSKPTRSSAVTRDGSDRRRQPTVNNGPSATKSDSPDVDPVTADRMWIDIINSERRGHRIRETNWGFLAEYDLKGRRKTPVLLSMEPVSYYSKVVPNTDSQQYGSRVSTPTGKTLQNMESLLFSSNRKQKLNTQFISY